MPQGIERKAKDVDQAQAALVQDLKNRGMLDDTLVVWGGEFGRTVYCQGTLTDSDYGRDHHPLCYSVWMAGGGIKGGTVYGATDELGYHVTENKCDIYDLWATVLHLMGLDHEELTYRHGGRDLRLVDRIGDGLDTAQQFVQVAMPGGPENDPGLHECGSRDAYLCGSDHGLQQPLRVRLVPEHGDKC